MGKVRKSRWLSPLTSRPNFVSIPTSTLVQRGYWPPPGRRLGREGAIRFWKSSSQGSDPRKRWFIPLVSSGMLLDRQLLSRVQEALKPQRSTALTHWSHSSGDRLCQEPEPNPIPTYRSGMFEGVLDPQVGIWEISREMD